MRVVCDYNKCTGMGMCEAGAPELFEVQVAGALHILNESPEENKRAELDAAVKACPNEALSIIED